MSGGSYDYAYRHVDDFVHMLRDKHKPLRAAFAALLVKVSAAMQAIEWVDSCDWGPDAEEAEIRACLPEGAELCAAREALQRAVFDANAVLARMERTP